MQVPSEIAQHQPHLHAVVAEIEEQLKPDVVHIRFSIGQDWSGDWAVLFRVLVSDDAGKHRLREVRSQVESRLDERVDFRALGLFSYYNFRGASEQAALQEEAWA